MRYSCPNDLEILSTPNGIGFYDPVTGDHWIWETPPSRALLAFLSASREVTTAMDLESAARTHFGDAATAVLAALIGAKLLVPHQINRRCVDSTAWGDYGWSAAARLHLHIQSLATQDYSASGGYSEDFRQMAVRLRTEAPPENFKRYPDASFLSLPRTVGSLGQVLVGTTEPCIAEWDTTHLGDFLRLVFGQIGTKRLAASGDHILRTSPSGGARHPTEAYIFIVNVHGVPPGIYHYCVEAHGLELVATPPNLDELIRNDIVVMRGREPSPLAFSIVYTTIFERSMYRYREPRSYRVVHLDIGHLFGTAHLLLDCAGVSYFSGYAVNEESIGGAIGLHILAESPMAHTTVGIL